LNQIRQIAQFIKSAEFFTDLKKKTEIFLIAQNHPEDEYFKEH